MKTHNRILLALAVAGAAALTVWSLQPRPIAVELAPVTRGPFEQTVTDDGRTRVRERYLVHAPLAGRLERIRLKAGDAVERGAVVALLTPTPPSFLDARDVRQLSERVGAAQAQLMRARAEAARIAAQRDQARADHERQLQLYQKGFVSATTREQAELSLRTAERSLDGARFAVEAAEHELAQARAALARYRGGDTGTKWEVTAPVEGAVLRVIQESEGAVALGAALLELADPRSLEAVVDVLSQEAVAIHPGMAARIDLGRGIEPLAARVRLIEPAAFTKVSALGVEEQRVNVVLDFTEPLDRVRTIGDGFYVEAAIVTTRLEDAIKIPAGALVRDGAGWTVFVAANGHATKRMVTVSQRNSQSAVITAGVNPDERVVVYPPDALRDGARIDARQSR